MPAANDEDPLHPVRQLSYRPPLALDRLMAFLATRSIAGVEQADHRVYRRAVQTDAGPAVVEVAGDAGSGRLVMRLVGGEMGPATSDELERRVRRLLDLDADALGIDRTLDADPVLAPLVGAAPGTRVPGAFDGFEIAVRAIVGQQVSVAGARTTLGRIAARFGEPLPAPTGSVTHLFPTPERLASAPREGLGMPAARADAIRAVAAGAADGALDLAGAGDPDATVEALHAIRGIGDWTASYVAMRALGQGDAFLPGDLGVRRGFAALGLPDDARSMIRHAERWRPWRAYAVMHLWHVPPPSRDGSPGGGGEPEA